MTMGSFVTGNMHYIRAPFVANIKPGHRVLILSDFSSDACVWQVVQATCAELGAETTVALFERLGLREHLTPQRSNGFRSMVDRIRADARTTLASAP